MLAAVLAFAPAARGAETLYLLTGGYLWVAPADGLNSAYTPLTAITGLGGGEATAAIDVRPANGAIYLLTYNPTPNPDQLRLYTLNPATAAATPVGGGAFSSPAADGTLFYEMDFNPVADRIRVITGDNKSFRLNPNDGSFVSTDTAPAFVAGDPSTGTPNLRGVAFDNNVAGATSATGWAWHQPTSPSGASDPFLRFGGPGGSPSTNAGQLTTIGATGLTNISGQLLGLDISGLSGIAYGSLQVFYGFGTTTTMGTINLATGKFTQLPAPANFSLTGFSIARSGALGLSSAGYSVTENGSNATVTVNRTGSTTGTFTVDYATSDGSAAAGSDYTSTTGTLTFADGETTKTFTVPVADDTADEGRESFGVELSNPTGNVNAGAIVARRTATLTIDDNDAPPVVPPPATTPPDTTRPTLAIAGASSSKTRKSFLKGFTVTLTPSEPASFAVTLEGRTSKATLASIKTILFSKSLKLAAGAQKVRVVPNKKGVGTVRKKRKVTLRVYATDAAGNRSAAVTKTITVKPDPKKRR